MIRSIFGLILAVLISESAWAGDGRIVGNGSDIREMMFRKAKVEAANRVGKVQLNQHLLKIGSQVPKNVAAMLQATDLLEKLAIDILSSPHFYDTKERTHCAWTNDPDPALTPPGLNTIRISLPTCGPFLEQEGRTYAIRTLMHESVHHLLRDQSFRNRLGVVFLGEPYEQYEQEEIYCDQVAELIMDSFERVVEAGTPHWSDISVDHQLDERGFHTALWTGRTGDARSSERLLIWGGCRETPNALYGCATYFNDGALYDPEHDKWDMISKVGAPEGRIEHASAWSEDRGLIEQRHKLFVWGGCADGDGCTRYLDSGGVLDPATRLWTPTTAAGEAPSARSNHTAVWSGHEYLVWGGSFGAHTPGQKAIAHNDGAAYDPVRQTWRQIPAAPIAGRSFHTAIWTGETGNRVTANKMLVWGGCDVEEYIYCKEHYNDGALYDPKTREWTPLTTTGANPTARRLHASVHIAEHNALVVWGGQRASRYLGDGAILDLGTLSWQPMKMPGPAKRARHSMVWTGDHLIVFGGETSVHEYAEDIGVFTFPEAGRSSGRWDSPGLDAMPLKVKNHGAAWTPFGMMIWGGQTDRRAFENIGAIFDPGEMLEN